LSQQQRYNDDASTSCNPLYCCGNPWPFISVRQVLCHDVVKAVVGQPLLLHSSALLPAPQAPPPANHLLRCRLHPLQPQSAALLLLLLLLLPNCCQRPHPNSFQPLLLPQPQLPPDLALQTQQPHYHQAHMKARDLADPERRLQAHLSLTSYH
jgi:hypothetical protein